MFEGFEGFNHCSRFKVDLGTSAAANTPATADNQVPWVQGLINVQSLISSKIKKFKVQGNGSV